MSQMQTKYRIGDFYTFLMAYLDLMIHLIFLEVSSLLFEVFLDAERFSLFI
jgi:hypothetical protein